MPTHEVNLLNTGRAITITNPTTNNTISADQNGNVGTDVSTDGAIHIENTGNTGIGLGVYSNIGATGAAPLVHFKTDNIAFDNYTLFVEDESVRGSLFQKYAGDLGNDRSVVRILTNQAFTGTNASAFQVYDGHATNSKPAAHIRKYGTGQAILVSKYAAGDAVTIDLNANGYGLYIDKDCSVDNTRTWAMRIDSDNAGAGSALGCGIDLSTFSVDEPLLKVVDDAVSSPGTLSKQVAIDVGGTTYYLYAYTTGS